MARYTYINGERSSGKSTLLINSFVCDWFVGKNSLLLVPNQQMVTNLIYDIQDRIGREFNILKEMNIKTIGMVERIRGVKFDCVYVNASGTNKNWREYEHCINNLTKFVVVDE